MRALSSRPAGSEEYDEFIIIPVTAVKKREARFGQVEQKKKAGPQKDRSYAGGRRAPS